MKPFAAVLVVLVAAFVWIVFVPFPNRNAWANSSLVTALENSHAKLGGVYRFNEPVEKSALVGFFPAGASLKSTESFLQGEGFACQSRVNGGGYLSFAPKDYLFVRCRRAIANHPLYQIGWAIDLTVNADQIVEDVTAIAYYDGP